MLKHACFVLIVLLPAVAACSDASDDEPRAAVTSTAAGSPAAATESSPAATSQQAGSTAASPAASPGAGVEGLDPATRAYVTAVNSRDLDALVQAFAPDGVVIDVGREFRGREAIRGWAAREVIGGALTLVEVRPYPRGTQMIVRFAPGGSGGFEACYTFDTDGQHITRANLQYRCP